MLQGYRAECVDEHLVFLGRDQRLMIITMILKNSMYFTGGRTSRWLRWEWRHWCA